jgi:hypothetical protein
MISGTALGVLALAAIVASGSKKKTAAKPRTRPKLPPPMTAKPKPLAVKPPAAKARPSTPLYVVPGSPPKGAVLPGRPKPAAAKPAPMHSAKKSPAKPAGGVKASPELEPNRGSPPAGYDPQKARAQARAIAAHLAKKGPASYSHQLLKTWQRQAALNPDGLYGGSSRGALIYFGVKDPPRPFFKPVATLPYVPPEQRTVTTTV